MGPSVARGNRRPLCGRWRADVAGVALYSGIGRTCSPPYVVCAALCGAEVVNVADHGFFGGPRFAQLDEDYKM